MLQFWRDVFILLLGNLHFFSSPVLNLPYITYILGDPLHHVTHYMIWNKWNQNIPVILLIEIMLNDTKYSASILQDKSSHRTYVLDKGWDTDHYEI